MPPLREDHMWAEIDIVEMFPNIHMEQVAHGVSTCFTAICKQHHWKPDAVCFHVHKGCTTQLDILGPRSTSNNLWVLTLHDLLTFLHFELYYNDLFVSGSSVLHETTGDAIGSTCAA